MGRGTVVLALVAAALASGCGEREEPLGELGVRYPVTVRGAGEESIVLEERPRRLVALDPGPAAFVRALGAARILVGLPARFSPRPPGTEEVTTPGGAVRVERVVSLEPDLILATPDTDPVDLARARRESEAPVYVQPAGSVDEIQRATVELGFVVGAPADARRLAASLARRVARVEERVAPFTPVPVFIDAGSLTTVPEQSLPADIVRRAGGANVAARAAPAEAFAPCAVARLDPELVLELTDRRPRRTARERRALLCPRRPLRRVAVPAGLLTEAGPSVARALEVVARALHPRAFR